MRGGALVLGLVGALLACGGETAPPAADGGPEGARACPNDMCHPYACDARTGRCITVCRRGEDCAPGLVCDRGFCVGTDCTPETAAARCGGYACVGGKCARDCALGPCTSGFYCRGDTGQCVRKCASRGDPVCGGYVCDVASGECEPYCRAGELECAPGYVCTAGLVCVAE